jgi:hypothetical protein
MRRFGIFQILIVAAPSKPPIPKVLTSLPHTVGLLLLRAKTIAGKMAKLTLSIKLLISKKNKIANKWGYLNR